MGRRVVSWKWAFGVGVWLGLALVLTGAGGEQSDKKKTSWDTRRWLAQGKQKKAAVRKRPLVRRKKPVLRTPSGGLSGDLVGDAAKKVAAAGLLPGPEPAWRDKVPPMPRFQPQLLRPGQRKARKPGKGKRGPQSRRERPPQTRKPRPRGFEVAPRGRGEGKAGEKGQKRSGKRSKPLPRPMFKEKGRSLEKLEGRIRRYYSKAGAIRVMVTTDKPLYRPGEWLWVRAALLAVRGNRPYKEHGNALLFSLVSPRGRVIRRAWRRIREGVAHTSMPLPRGLPGGEYRVRVRTFFRGMRGEKKVTLGVYQPPRIKKKLEFLRKGYDAGQRVQASLELASATGKALANHLVQVEARLAGKLLRRWKAETGGAGRALLRFRLPEKLKTDDGLLTVLIRKDGVTESITRAIPLVVRDIQVKFFPEGGRALAGWPARVYFAARRNLDLKPIDIQAEVRDAAGKVVTKVRSFHDGMGRFVYTPKPGVRYTLHVTSPRAGSFVLPAPASQGVGLQLLDDFASKHEEIRALVFSEQARRVYVVALQHETPVYSGAFKLSKGENLLAIKPAKKWRGILRLVIMDRRGNAMAERLIFRHGGRGIKFSLSWLRGRGGRSYLERMRRNYKRMYGRRFRRMWERYRARSARRLRGWKWGARLIPHKGSYRPYDIVGVRLKLHKPDGSPLSGASLAASVVDDTVLRFADDHEAHFLAQRFLTTQLIGKIHKPNFYFDKRKAKAPRALDLVMGVHGWLDFSWQEVCRGKAPHKKELKDLSVYDPNALRRRLKKRKWPSARRLFSRKKRERKAATRLKNMRNKQNPRKPQITKRDKQTKGKRRKASGKKLNPPPPPQSSNPGPRIFKRKRKLEKSPRRSRRMYNAPTSPLSVARKSYVSRPPMAYRMDPSFHRRKREGLRGFGFRDSKSFARNMRQYRKQREEAIRRAWQTFWSRSRRFPNRVYKRSNGWDHYPTRHKTRDTIYWNPALKTDSKGEATFVFGLSDKVTSFRLRLSGFGDGLVGRHEAVIASRLPFHMHARIPLEVSAGDALALPVTLRNESARPLRVRLRASVSAALRLVEDVAPKPVLLAPGSGRTFYYPIRVFGKVGVAWASFVATTHEGRRIQVRKQLRIQPRGFPRQLVWAGTIGKKSLTRTFVLPEDIRNGTPQGVFQLYPSPLGSLMQIHASMLREPHGCFEQTSSTNFPNTMLVQLMQRQGANLPGMIRAAKVLSKGYFRLAGFETISGGFSLYGRPPGSVRLTAYGIFQFSEMKKVFPLVDEAMLRRSIRWLVNRRHADGSYQQARGVAYRVKAALNQNVYTAFCLAEAGHKDITRELKYLRQHPKAFEDPYFLGLFLNALLLTKGPQDPEAKKLLSSLHKMQRPDGSFQSKTLSAFYGRGRSFRVETTALALLAMLRGKLPKALSIRALRWLYAHFSPRYGYGSTQATVLALKAILAFSKSQQSSRSNGTLSLHWNNSLLAKRSYSKRRVKAIEIPIPIARLKPGKNTLTVALKAKNEIPFAFQLGYTTYLPESTPGVPLALFTRLSKYHLQMGDVVRLTAHLRNKSDKALPTTLLRVRFPGALRFQTWQLKAMRDKGLFDLYETRPRELILYLNGLKAKQIKTFHFDLVARVPGNYNSMAASAYLYYTNEQKAWSRPLWVSVQP